MLKLPLDETGDRVVAAFPYRDFVLVVTERGRVFKLDVDRDPTGDMIRLITP